MSNINNNNFNNLKIKLNYDEYWDFFINKSSFYHFNNNINDDNKLIGIDFSDKNNYINDNVKVKSNWICAFVKDDYSLNNIGYTGYDNGIFYMEIDEITNKEFIELYTKQKLPINSTDLILHQVTGSTQQYEYPITVLNDSIKLNGGFYQGFFKTNNDEYEVLPSDLKNGDNWHFEFVLNKSNFLPENKKYPILNEKYPNNKGIFFYIGVRAENKWIYLYENENEIKEENLCILSGLTDIDSCYVDDDIDISDFSHETDGGIKINKNEEFIDTDNQFLIMNRTQTGYTVNTYEKNMQLRMINEKNSFNDNLFLFFNRTETGYTVNNISDLIETYKTPYNIYNDLGENALAFIIKDDGSIGYRYLITNCNKDDNIEVIENYSKPNLINSDEWYYINIRIKGFEHKMILYFYINDKLIFVSNELPKLNLRKLNEVYEKQESVPYNISIGGGTQGLIETILPNYMFKPDKEYPLQKYFSGSFIGYIKEFNFIAQSMSYNDIKANYKSKIIDIYNK